MLSQKAIEENHTIRLNAHAADITGHARRIETLEIEQAGNDRTFREVINGSAELASRIEELEGQVQQCTTELDHRRAMEEIEFRIAAQERGALVKHIEQLERLLKENQDGRTP